MGKIKQIRTLFYFLGLVVLLVSVLFLSILFDKPVDIPDPAFEQAIREELNYYYKPLYQSQLLAFVELDLSYRDIESISGIEHFRNLEELNLRGNKILDVRHLRSLTKLRSLDLGYNRILDLEQSNFTQLKKLKLIHLNLDHNIIEDEHTEVRLSSLEGLQNFTSLQNLSVVDNNIDDLSPLNKLNNLISIDLSENHLVTLEELGNKPKIEYLNLRDNRLEDISTIQDLSLLNYLNLHSNNRIKDISPIENLVNLETLIMRNVPIDKQISVLENLINLSRLNIRNSGVSDISVLAQLMSRGALQDTPEKEIYAYLDMLENPILNDSYHLRMLSPFWDNINTKYPFEINDSILNPPVFSADAGFYDEGFLLKLETSHPEGDIYYTLDGSEPSEEAIKYTSPILLEGYKVSEGKMPEATIIRAKVFIDGGYDTSPTISKTYFIGEKQNFTSNLPVVSFITDPDYFFDPEIGIATRDNYPKRGKKWERPIHIEFFEENSKKTYNSQALVRIHGRSSRNLSQKSLRIYGDYNYEEFEPLNFEFFPGREVKATGEPLTQYNTLIFRNSGNDWAMTMFRDGMIHKLVEHTSLDTQAYRPVNVYLNGTYWGILNIRERLDEYYIENHYDIDLEDILIYEVNHGEGFYEQDPESNQFLSFLDDLRDVKHPNQIVYDLLDQTIDIQNFIDNQIIYLFSANEDWKGNNVKFWKKDVPDFYSNAAYGHDGRWRWMVIDMDFGFRWPNANMMPIITEYSSRTQLISTLMKYPEFQLRFINRYADLLNTAFLPERVIEEIDLIESHLAEDIGRHINRWNAMENSIGKWYENVDQLREFAVLRPDVVRQNIIQEFNLSGIVGIKVSTNSDQGYVKINTIDILETTPGIYNPSEYQGVYFRDVPITLTAFPKSGYYFSHWETEDNEKKYLKTITLYPQSDLSVTAVFIKSQFE